MVVTGLAAISVLVAVSMIALQLSRLSYLALLASTTTEDRLSHPANIAAPIVSTLAGIVIEVKAEQYAKAV